MNRFIPPYIGAAYYPEDWPEEEIESDISRMQKMGINVVRIAEFAWSKMEPREGEYDFVWLHKVVTALNNAGIAVVLCTPTATPPAWLTQKYPEVLRILSDGLPKTHGHYCPTSETCRKFSRKITEKLASEFYKYENLVAWQLDNEFSGECYCQTCERKFREWLKKIYGTIDKLNTAWNTNLWSQTYNDFSQIPLPNKTRAWHHPSLVYRYRQFLSSVYADFATEQAQIIRKYSNKPITTNAMPAFCARLDHEELFRNLDFIANDLYEKPELLWRLCFEFDWMRPLKKRPYWVMETSATWTGNLFPENVFVHHEGALRAKMWLSYALGGEAVLFWLWRAHWSGQQMEHGSLTYPWGEPTLSEKQVKQVSSELLKCKDFLLQTKPMKPAVAIHYSFQSMWLFDYGRVAEKFNYDNAMYDFYKIFLDLNIARDLIFPVTPVDDYEIVFSPYLPIIPDELLKRMKEFVSSGGTWVIGPLSAFRNEDASAHRTGAYGELENLLGVHVRHRFPPNPRGAYLKATSEGSRARVKCTLWCDAYESQTKNKILAKYSDGPAKGLGAIVECPLGKGKVILLGTLPDTKWLSTWLRKEILSSLASKRTQYKEIVSAVSNGIVVVVRVNELNHVVGLIAIDITGKGGTLNLSQPGKELLSNTRTKKRVSIEPCGVKVIKF